MLKYLIVGLGNPGKQYKDTKHNLGFMVLNDFTRQLDISFNRSPGAYEWAFFRFNNSEAVFIKPLTFMNRSGIAVADAYNRLEIPLNRILILLDDLALPLGRLRMRPTGSHGGHKGLVSICRYLHSEKIPRLRMGIGEMTEVDSVHYVLSPFSHRKLPEVKDMIQKAGHAVRNFISLGIQRTMNTVNS